MAVPASVGYLLYLLPLMHLVVNARREEGIILLAAILSIYVAAGWGLVSLWVVGLRLVGGRTISKPLPFHWSTGILVGMTISLFFGSYLLMSSSISMNSLGLFVIVLAPILPAAHIVILLLREGALTIRSTRTGRTESAG